MKRLDLAYQEYGDPKKSLMVFLHGGGVSSWMWKKQVQHFTNYHCLTIDLPEHGASRNAGDFSILSSAEKINEIIEEKRNRKKVIVIGFSLGAQVAIQMLSLKPNLIDYAIINSALVRPPSKAVRKMMRQSIYLSSSLVKSKAFAKLQAKTLYIGKDYFDTYYEESSQISADTLIRIFDENMSFKIPENFRDAKANILVTVGGNENSLMKRSAKELVKNHPNCTGINIPRVGHGISLHNPGFFNSLVENWLKDGSLPEEVILL